METGMRKMVFAALAAGALLLTSCASVNNLDGYDFHGARIASEMADPPEPRVDVDYDVGMRSHDPFFSAFSIIANVAMASQAGHAEGVMRAALSEVDVPALVEREATAACIRALRAEEESSRHGADYILSFEIDDWGLDAHSYRTAVSLRMHVTASLREIGSDTLVWRGDVTVDEQASPDMFGLPQVVGTLMTANTLSELTAEELTRGFNDLARHAARKVSRLLEDDLDSARGDW